MNQSLLFLSCLILISCTNLPKPEQHVREVSSAQISSKATYLYNWTNNPKAFENTNDYVSDQLSRAEACLTAGKGCIGEQLYAGPGLYTVDNPFTSYDYGNTVVIVQALAGQTNYHSAEPVDSADRGLDLSLIKNKNYSAILYNFKFSDFNTKALVVRKRDILNNKYVEAVRIAPAGFKKFADHEAYQCNSESTPADVMRNWGDHNSFMAITFLNFNDLTRANFINNGQINQMAYLAAMASDVVAMPDSEVTSLVEKLNKTTLDEVGLPIDSFSCSETMSNSFRSCLAQRIYDTLRDNPGIGRRITYAWDVTTALKAFQLMKLMSAAEAAQIQTPDNLKSWAEDKMKKHSANIQMAFDCMNIVKSSVAQSHLGMWAE